jgi:DNA-binding NarL/FixJ family response regulator
MQPQYRVEILRRRNCGWSQARIAQSLGLAIKTVQAVLRADCEQRKAVDRERLEAAKVKKTQALRQLAEADAVLAALG